MSWIMAMALLSGQVEFKKFKTFSECNKAAHVWMDKHRKETAICISPDGKVAL